MPERRGAARRKRSIENEEFSRSEYGWEGGGGRKGLKTFVGCLAARSRILVDRPDKRAALVRDVTGDWSPIFRSRCLEAEKGRRPYTLILKRFIDKDTETQSGACDRCAYTDVSSSTSRSSRSSRSSRRVWWAPRYAERVIINVRGCRAVVSCSLVVVEKDEGVKLAR